MKDIDIVIIVLSLLLLVVALSFMSSFTPLVPAKPKPSISKPSPSTAAKKIDDWQAPSVAQGLGIGPSAPAGAPSPVVLKEGAMGVGTIGLATGGAKDIINFRRNIENDYLPLPTDITYEGLFYDYFFDTGQQKECQKLFCPSYSYAISRDPLSKEEEYYLSVGLNSGLKESDFQRKKLNLVIVLDVSGSMSSSFSKYYYDRFGRRQVIEETEESGKSKMEVAAESVVALLDHLKDNDRFGMVLFNNQAFLAKPLRLVRETDMQKIKDHILEIQANGGTQMSAGMKMGTELYDQLKEQLSDSDYENRIIFLTDAMPNLGKISEQGLLGITKNNSENKIYTTFIGIGVDFNTELVDFITKIKGANYYTVYSPKQFKQRMDEEFEYMVTPLVFNLKLTVKSEGYKIEKVYGSPEANKATGEIMKVDTLFPSKKEAGKTKGGLVLLKLKKLSSEPTLKLATTYQDREGKTGGQEVTVRLEEKKPEFFQNTGIRKGILLCRYANLMKAWAQDEAERYKSPEPIRPLITPETGIIIPPPFTLGKWERQSIPLAVSSHYKNIFTEFATYFEKESSAIGDKTLNQELKILNKLKEFK